MALLTPNQLPSVTITSGPVDTLSTPLSWLVDIAWRASDPDGSVDRVEYAVDPPSARQAALAQAETTWVASREGHALVRFRASSPETLGPGGTASEFHVFVIRAVDDRGAASPRVVRAFYARTVAPDVQITRPLPSAFLESPIGVPGHVRWSGLDPDGEGDRQPAAYRYRMLPLDPATLFLVADPDSLLRLARADDWAGWRRVPADSASLLVVPEDFPGSGALLFAVVAEDAAGALTPYLLPDRNFIRLRGQAGAISGPRIRIFGPYFDFTYESGGYSVDPLRWIPLEVLAGTPLRLHWEAVPEPGGRQAVSARWMLDGNVADDTPRQGLDDFSHWSPDGPPSGSVELPGLTAGEHFLYVEVRDDEGGASLGIVHIIAVEVTAGRELLIVNDTRLEVDKFPDRLNPTTPAAYTKPWPSKSELDTFLFARGGFPWRGTKNPATGATSPPGLFAPWGVDARAWPIGDTLGTRLGLVNSAQTVTLASLARYRHVLWLVDAAAAQYIESLDQRVYPVTALYAMSSPGRPSTLAAYASAGGRLWLAGGGAALASLRRYDRSINNSTNDFLFTIHERELGPGRLLHDFGHLQSAISSGRAVGTPTRSPAARGGWSGQGMDGRLSAPDYSRLPATLRLRAPDTDPLPPTRLASQSNLYYLQPLGYEAVVEPNRIVETVDTEGTGSRRAATLDTLMDVPSLRLGGASAPSMLYYHGRDNAPFVFTGFDLWSWTREDCQALVDFVLGEVWGMSKAAPGVAVSRPTNAASRAVAPVRRADTHSP